MRRSRGLQRWLLHWPLRLRRRRGLVWRRGPRGGLGQVDGGNAFGVIRVTCGRGSFCRASGYGPP
eukprot:11178213-Lingulodinium_polyedra.AAC.1